MFLVLMEHDWGSYYGYEKPSETCRQHCNKKKKLKDVLWDFPLYAYNNNAKHMK